MSVATLAVQRVTQPVRRALRNDFIRHSALVFGAAMAGNIFNYLFNFALSRRLGVEGFATLSSLISFLMIVSIPTSILSLIVVKYAAIYNAAGDMPRVRRLAELLLRFTIIASAVILLAGIVLRSATAAFLRIPDSGAIILCVAIIAVGVVTASMRAILQGEQDFLRFSGSTLLEIILKLTLAVSLVDAGFGVNGALCGWLVAALGSLTYTLWVVMRKHGTVARDRVHLNLNIPRLMQTTIGIGLGTGFLTFMSFMDVPLVKHYFDAHQAGLYAAVNLSGKVMLFLVGFVPAVVLPKAVSKNAKGENPIPLLLQAASVTICMSGAALVVFGMFPGRVLDVLAGRDFVAGAPLVLQYDAAMCLLAIVTLLVNYRIGIHRFEFLYPLGAVLICEVIAVTLLHRTLWDIVHILMIGHAVAIATCSFGLSDRSRSVAVPAEAA